VLSRSLTFKLEEGRLPDVWQQQVLEGCGTARVDLRCGLSGCVGGGVTSDE
jgi:hypothetical protein